MVVTAYLQVLHLYPTLNAPKILSRKINMERTGNTYRFGFYNGKLREHSRDGATVVIRFRPNSQSLIKDLKFTRALDTCHVHPSEEKEIVFLKQHHHQNKANQNTRSFFTIQPTENKT